MTTTNPWNRFPPPFYVALDDAGETLPGALLYFYASGTSTPLTTYSDANLTIPNTNPVVADAGGQFGSIFLQNQEYKVVLKNSSDVEQWTADPVAVFNFAGVNRVIGSVETIALARAVVTVGAGLISGDLLFLNGHLATGDGGDRVMKWSSSSSATDNSATVLKPTDVVAGNGRWLIINSNASQKPQIFGAVNNGASDDGPALQAWLDFHSGRALCKCAYPSTFLSNQVLSSTVGELDWAFSTLNFGAAIAHTNPCLTINPPGSSLEPAFCGLRNLFMNCQTGGMDGIRFVHGTPQVSRVHVRDSYRDCFSLYADGNAAHFLEASEFSFCFGWNVGQHFFHLYILATAGIPFINKTTIRKCEHRGIGRRFTDSNSVACTFDTVTTVAQKIGGLIIEDNLFDGILTGSLANAGLGACVMFRKINGGANWRAEHVRFIGNDVESTTGTTGAKFLIDLDAGITVNYVTSNNISPAGWATNYNQTIKLNYTSILDDDSTQVYAWTPTLAGTTVAGTNTYSGNTIGRYWVDGNRVFVSGWIQMTAKDAAMAGNIDIAGLPYPVYQYQGFSLGLAQSLTFAGGFLTIRPNLGLTTARLINNISGGAAANIVAADITAVTEIQFFGVYNKNP